MSTQCVSLMGPKSKSSGSSDLNCAHNYQSLNQSMAFFNIVPCVFFFTKQGVNIFNIVIFNIVREPNTSFTLHGKS